jgi:di/tricarboxylate transporter
VEPRVLTGEIVLTLAIAAGALALFLWNRVRVDVVGILVMTTLILTGLVTPQQGISGFANEATVTVAAMFVLSAALVRTGAVDVAGRWISRLAGRSELGLLLVSIGLVIPLSAFINNTPVVVVMIPIILGLTRNRGIAPSRLFMPVSFASQMGGTLTLIGTSTNLLVAGLVLDLGLERIGLFTITPPALVLTAIGCAYLITVGRWITPSRATPTDLIDTYELRDYLSGLIVEENSPLVGQTLRDARFGEEYGLQVIGIERAGERIPTPRGSTQVESHDLLIVRGSVPQIARIAQTDHLRIAGTRPEITVPEAAESPAGNEPRELAELIVTPRSPLVGRTIREVHFRGRYGVPVLAIQRHGETLHDQAADVRLEPGDLLLVEGTSTELRRIHAGRDLAVLGALSPPRRRMRKMRYAIAILVGVIFMSAFEITTILVAAITGVALMFILGCLTPDEAYEDVDWMVIVLLGSIIPLGIAMQNTGTAEYLAAGLLRFTHPLGLFGVLAAFYLLTSLLTELISNNAAAVVMTPVAIATAVGLDASPLPFVIAVMIAASNSFMTPIGYQTNTFIYGPGGYRFSDFIRIGGPLNLLLLIAATFVIPFFFPF